MSDDAAALTAAVLAAASGGQLEATLHEIVAVAVRHVDARYGALGVLTPDGSALDRFVTVGMDADDHRRIGRPPAGDGILGLLVQDPTPLRLGDLSTHPASVGVPPGHPPMRSFLGVPVRARDSAFGHLYLTEKRTGGEFTPADLEITRAMAAVAGLAIENARLLEHAEQRRAWSQAGTDLATALLSGRTTGEVLRDAAGRVAELAGADAVGILVPVPGDEGTLIISAAVGPEAADSEGVRIPLTGTRLGEAHRSGTPVLVEDVASTQPGATHAPVIGEFTDRYGPALYLPLGGPSPPTTLVALRVRTRPPFDPAVLEPASAFVTHATVAMRLVRSQLRERRLQVQADRDRIARDLHDHVVQRIFATALALDRLGRSLGETAPDVAGRIAGHVDELDGTIARIRASIFELHGAQDSSSDAVRRRLAEVVRSVIDGHGLRPDLRVRSEVEDLPPDLAGDVVAVVRELVTNVLRHAGATRVTVSVALGDEVRVVVTDDGGGLPAVTVRSGLANLTDRAERRGGRLEISTGTSGTEIRWTVPLPG
ncbi:GAF domain-containing protein [Blastococcus sp. MG754426]|uniref:GAF domain-containing sensor histidine kinase n=1 Tax=unclassified Blastococcus TaxID=2619396 RepID=UPI001EF10187|nr:MULTISPECIES: GAF domain-containing protein [unclassified Blastococcus]MCF6509220.1 GAF domain-containing protein [Blastococcus sp. MG754426]MCF6513788.1 GAF domain-containing protein [Blastococcus sp. MG754427]